MTDITVPSTKQMAAPNAPADTPNSASSSSAPEGAKSTTPNLIPIDSHTSGLITTGNGWFKGHDGANLYEQWWLPETPKAAVVVVHGYAEHSGRYAHVAETFVDRGYAVYSYDHRSHGKSDGENTYVNSFDHFVDDLDIFVRHIQERHIQPQFGALPFFMLGHSMGGLITSRYMVTRQPSVDGVVLTGPYLAVSDDVPKWLLGASNVVSALLPKLPTIALEYKYVTQDPHMLELHKADSLIYRGNIPARTGAEMNRAAGQMQTAMEKVVAPLLVLHGGADKIATIKGSEQLYERATSDDKTFKIYEGLYHEILNEFEREEVKADILTWMDQRYVC